MGQTPPASGHDFERGDVPGDRPRNSWIAPGSSDVVGEASADPEPSAESPTDDPSVDESAPRARRILAKIPGLARLSEQSGWAGHQSDLPPAHDPGWVFHQGDGAEAFRGWLYHYADGAMVDADGVEYAFPDDDDEETASAAEEPPGPPDLVLVEPPHDPEPEAATEPETDAEPESDADAKPDAEPDAEPEPEPEPNAESTTDDAEEPEPTSDEAADAESDAESDANADAEFEPEREPEPASEPPADSDPDPELKPEPERPSDIPRFVEYSPTHVRGYLLGTVFVIASVTAVLTLFVAVSESSSAALVIAGGCVVLALVAWWALLAYKPTVVSIREGVLDITRGGHTDRYELTDPSTVVEFNGRPGAPTWTAMVKEANGPRTILRPSQVKPRQFERIVRHHRSRATAARPDEAATS